MLQESIRTTIFLPAKDHKLLKDLAHQTKTSMAKMIKIALDQVYLMNKKTTSKSLLGIAADSNLKPKEFDALKKSWNPKAWEPKAWEPKI